MAGGFFQTLTLVLSLRSWRTAAGALATLLAVRRLREGDSLEKFTRPWEGERGMLVRRRVRGDLAIPQAVALLPLFFYPLFPRRCLRRSLVLYRHLVRLGSDPELVVGVRKEGTGLAGHAWVRLDGEPLWENPTELDTYTVSQVIRRGRAGPHGNGG